MIINRSLSATFLKVSPNIVFGLLAFFYFFFLHNYIADMGGVGLQMPLNIQCWLFMSLIMLVVALRIIILGQLGLSSSFYFAALGAVLLSLPLLWTPTQYHITALPRLAGIWGALLFFFMLQQLHLPQTTKRFLLFLLLIAAVIESGISLFQWTLPHLAERVMEYNFSRMEGKPYGIFQQVNVLASFLATGFGVALWFFYNTRTKGFSWWMALVSQPAIFFTLLLTQSRVGICGALTVLFLLSAMASYSLPETGWAFRKKTKVAPWLRYFIVILLIILGLIVNVEGITFKKLDSGQLTIILVLVALIWCLFISRFNREALRRQEYAFLLAMLVVAVFYLLFYSGFLSQHGNVFGHTELDFSHIYSNHERIEVLKGTGYLIAQHPWAGSGLGSFESAYPVAVHQAGMVSHLPYTIEHPHNEFLYVWAEGGIVALAGILLVCGACITSILNRKGLSRDVFSEPDDFNPGFSFSAPILVLLFPIFFHMMLEYPLYQSAPHLLTVLLLVRIGQQERAETGHGLQGVSKGAGVRICVGLLAIILAAAAFTLYQGMHFQQVLTTAERQNLTSLPRKLMLPEGLTEYERYDFDRHTLDLLDYNRSHDQMLLDDYLQWSQSFIKVHGDANVYASSIKIAQFEGKNHLAEYISQRAHLSLPKDPRFAQ